MHRNIKKNIKIVNGEVKFVKRKRRSDSNEDSEKSAKEKDQLRKAEKAQLAQVLTREKDVQQNKMVMSRADLMHLLEDSIEKTQRERKDLEINDRCWKTKKFI